MKKLLLLLIAGLIITSNIHSATSDPDPSVGGRERSANRISQDGGLTVWRRGDVEARNERALAGLGDQGKSNLITITPDKVAETQVVTVPEDTAIYKELRSDNPYTDNPTQKPRFERLDRENVKTDTREKSDPYDPVKRPWDQEVRTPKDEVKKPIDERSERLERYDIHGNNRPENLERAKRLTPKDRQRQLMHTDAALKDGTRARNANFDEPTGRRLFGSPMLIE